MVKILIDSSAWIHFFRGSPPAFTEVVKRLIWDDIAATCGPVLTEVVRGARDKKEEKTLRNKLLPLICYSLQEEDFWEAASLGVSLGRKGYTVNTLDLLIAHVCLRERIPILHDDSDFEFIARHASLKTLRL
ncbi:MAG TPA: PIN domain-containing protein [bacterium]|nr:PIN domain-containing protein [bacterium]